MSSSVNGRGLRLSTCSRPNGCLPLLPMMATLAVALTPLSIKNDG